MKLYDTQEASGRGRDWMLIAVALALLVGARLWRLGEACLWFDEIFGLHAARHGWGGLLRFAALDLIHPPLFYLLLKAWVAVGGESAWWLRLFSVLASVLAAGAVWLLGRELGLTRRTVAVALLLAAASGYLVKYAQEVRMYSLLLLFAACSLWLFARLCDAGGSARLRGGASARRQGGASARWQGGTFVALACANLLLVYTHYFGWLLVGLELAFLLAWRRGLAARFAAWSAAVALLFAPWAWAVWSAASAAGGLAQNIGWAARPRARDIFLPYLLLHEPFRFQRQTHEPAVLRLSVLFALLVFAPPLLALAWRTLRTRTRGEARGETHAGRETSGHDETHVRDEASERDETDVRGVTDVRGEIGWREEANARQEMKVREETNAREETKAREGADASVESDARGGSGLPERLALRFLVFFSIAPVALSFLLAHALPHSVWGTRHLIVVAPAYLLLAAHALTSLRPGWLAACFYALLGCWLALAAALSLTSRPAEPVWCAWGTLARAAAVRDEEARPRDGDARARDGDARPRGEGAQPRDEGAQPHARTPARVKVYAFEDLVAYQLWHELRAAGSRGFEVAVVRGVPGVADDAAFFLPRGFDEVSAVDASEAFGEERFWLAFRAPARAEEHPAVKSLAARGYAVSRRLEVTAAGQTAYMILAARR